MRNIELRIFDQDQEPWIDIGNSESGYELCDDYIDLTKASWSYMNIAHLGTKSVLGVKCEIKWLILELLIHYHLWLVVYYIFNVRVYEDLYSRNWQHISL